MVGKLTKEKPAEAKFEEASSEEETQLVRKLEEIEKRLVELQNVVKDVLSKL